MQVHLMKRVNKEVICIKGIWRVLFLAMPLCKMSSSQALNLERLRNGMVVQLATK